MLLWNQTWCGPAAEYPVTGGVSLTWAQTDNVCCVPDRQMAFSTHKLRSHKIRSALTKLHTYIHAYDTDRVRQSHTASHIMRLIWKEWEKSCSLSLIHANTCSGSWARSHIYSWSHTPFTKQSHCTHTGGQPHISFSYRVHAHANHTHRVFSLYAIFSAPLTQIQESSPHITLNLTLLFGVNI